ncbi:hypothetical protein [Streptosporangium sp. NPDC051022]|uniref:hypothetical protein n=1 Tax=Streptosporangium sp. NPDC051022 TaxID=3155752 RepID=UPI00342D134C
MITINQIQGAPLPGILKYLHDEYSFSFHPLDPAELERRSGAGVTSFVIDTLQIEVDVRTGVALYVWGYHPHGSWVRSDLPVPKRVRGAAPLDAECELDAGVSIAVPGGRNRLTEYNPENDWIRVSPRGGTDENLIEIADGVILGKPQGGLGSVWLNPVFGRCTGKDGQGGAHLFG